MSQTPSSPSTKPIVHPLPVEYPDTCSEEDCEESVIARGLCRKHYLRKWRVGDLPAAQQKPREAPYVIASVTMSRDQLQAINKLVAVRKTKRSGLYRTIIDFFFQNALTPEERAALDEGEGTTR